jgi:hypothetical protein
MTEQQTRITPQENQTVTGPKWGRILAWGGLLAFLTLVGPRIHFYHLRR